MDSLFRALEGTLSPDNAVRKAQEEVLQALERAPGYTTALLRIVQAPELSVQGTLQTLARAGAPFRRLCRVRAHHTRPPSHTHPLQARLPLRWL